MRNSWGSLRGALTGNGFNVPEDIEKVYTNTGATREPFDQIAVRIKDKRFKQGAGGVFDYRDYIYRDGPTGPGSALDSDFYRPPAFEAVEAPLPVRAMACSAATVSRKDANQLETQLADKYFRFVAGMYAS